MLLFLFQRNLLFRSLSPNSGRCPAAAAALARAGEGGGGGEGHVQVHVGQEVRCGEEGGGLGGPGGCWDAVSLSSVVWVGGEGFVVVGVACGVVVGGDAVVVVVVVVGLVVAEDNMGGDVSPAAVADVGFSVVVVISTKFEFQYTFYF